MSREFLFFLVAVNTVLVIANCVLIYTNTVMIRRRLQAQKKLDDALAQRAKLR